MNLFGDNIHSYNFVVLGQQNGIGQADVTKASDGDFQWLLPY